MRRGIRTGAFGDVRTASGSSAFVQPSKGSRSPRNTSSRRRYGFSFPRRKAPFYGPEINSTYGARSPHSTASNLGVCHPTFFSLRAIHFIMQSLL